MKREEELPSEMVITSLDHYCSECRFNQGLWLDAHFLEVIRQLHLQFHLLFVNFYYPEAVHAGENKECVYSLL